jgi:hypothetical protein
MSASSRVTGALIAAGLALGAGVAFAPTASAGPSPAGVTTLSFTPARGADTTPMYLVVPKPCPAQASNVLAEATGHGFLAAGQPVVNNSTSGVSHTAPFVLPLQDTFNGFAADNGTTLKGPYHITLTCINRLRTITYASFSGTVTFSDSTHYVAPAPPKSVVDAIIASQQPAHPGSAAPGAGTQPGASGAPRQPGSSAAAGGSGTTGAQGSPPGSAKTGAATGAGSGAGNLAPAADTPARHRHSGAAWQPFLVAGAVLLIVLAILLRIREVRFARRRENCRLRRPPAAHSDSADSSNRSESADDSDQSDDSDHSDRTTLAGSSATVDPSKGHHS